MAEPRTQQLHASNRSTRIGEALEARIKDPLWFLARQWQTGEFEAEMGGRPALMMLQTRDWAFETLTIGGRSQPLDRAAPLEAQVEAEGEDGTSPAWRAEALDYAFGLGAQGHNLAARDYDGRALDWFHFELTGRPAVAAPAMRTRRMTPTQLYFRGAPHPRWWRFEEAGAFFDRLDDPEPNVLSLLLPEFFYTDIDNWYITPLPMQAGSLHEVVLVQVCDSFGILSDLSAAPRTPGDFALFGLDGTGGAAALDPAFLLVPNAAAELLDNDELEEVRFLRDEQANLVWAREVRTLDSVSGLSRLTPPERVGVPGAGPGDGLPHFLLKTPTERSWIPYVPRQSDPNGALNGSVHLRRARTDETASSAAPQYRAQIIAEAVRLREEAVPPSGLRVRRIARFARGSDGAVHFWTGRVTEAGQRTTRPGLTFDTLDGEA